MVINNNISSLFTSRQLTINESALTKSMEKLSSGLKINRAGDDASNLAVSEKLRSQIRGLNQASRNINNGISFIQTTESYLSETSDVLQRLRELAIQSANGIYTDEDRMMISVEVSQLVDEIDRIASHAQFNGQNLLTGRFASDGWQTMQLHIGANMDQSTKIYIGTMTSESLGLKNSQGEDGRISIDTVETANQALGNIDSALKQLNSQRANLGAYQNRFEMASVGIATASENMQAAESRIRDADMATEIVAFTRNQILQQASTAMLAQANNQSASVLKLLS
jgi:flagellin